MGSYVLYARACRKVKDGCSIEYRCHHHPCAKRLKPEEHMDPTTVRRAFVRADDCKMRFRVTITLPDVSEHAVRYAARDMKVKLVFFKGEHTHPPGTCNEHTCTAWRSSGIITYVCYHAI